MGHDPETGAARPEQGGREVLRGRKERSGLRKEGGLGGCSAQDRRWQKSPH